MSDMDTELSDDYLDFYSHELLPGLIDDDMGYYDIGTGRGRLPSDIPRGLGINMRSKKTAPFWRWNSNLSLMVGLIRR